MNIIGVSAKKQGGKSTFVNILKTQLPCWKVLRFADKLKEIVIDCFVPPEWDWRVDNLDSDEKKNTVLPCGKTVRQLLQLVGTDWFRHTYGDCWINAYGKSLKSVLYPLKPEQTLVPLVLTPDVRFPNELRYIQEHGGKVVRLLRAPFEFEDQHESETALDTAMWATLLRWDLNTNNIFRAIRPEMLTTEQKTQIQDMHATWLKNPVLFDQIVDNRNRTIKDQEEWIVNWINPNFE
jgi:hypothetical protein